MTAFPPQPTAFPPQPTIAAPGEWHFPTPSRTRLDNGLEVVAYQLPGQHVVSANLVLDIPLSAEKRDREGVATVGARCLDEGTRSHGGDEFAELLETEGAAFGIDVSLAGLEVVLDVPATRLERAFGLFAEAVVEPSLNPADVDRHVQLRLAEIEQAQANSAQLASIAFRQAVFDPEHRASRMNGGEPDTVATLTAEAVQDFHARHFGPRGATLVLAGDFGSDPFALAEAAFGSWSNPGQAAVEHRPPVPTARSSRILDRPGAVQADVRLGGFGVDRQDPRWADITVASYAMGGAFLSRLNAVLREDKGYTYGVRLHFAPLRAGGSFAVQGSFRTEVVADALAEARDLLDVKMRPFTRHEVDEAVAFFVGVSPLRYATADGISEQAAVQVLAQLEDTYVDSLLADLRAVTPESATQAYRSLVQPDQLSLVVVGDAAAIADPLRAAGFPVS